MKKKKRKEDSGVSPYQKEARKIDGKKFFSPIARPDPNEEYKES